MARRILIAVLLFPLALAVRAQKDDFAVAYEQVKGGQLRAVSITSPGPYPLAKEIEPTAKTLPGFELMPAFGWVGPANMPPDIVKKLVEELIAVGKIPEVRTALEKSMPKGVSLKQEAIKPPLVKPYVWTARHDAKRQQLRFKGLTSFGD